MGEREREKRGRSGGEREKGERESLKLKSFCYLFLSFFLSCAQKKRRRDLKKKVSKIRR